MSTTGEDAGVGIATAMANDLGHGTLHRWVKRAAHVFDRGIDDERAVEQASIAFEVRLLLEEVAMRTGAPALIDALAVADDALRSFGAAVLLIDDDRYASATRDVAVDEETWWGHRAAMDEELPAAELTAGLAGTRAPAPARVHRLSPRPRVADRTDGVFLAAAADADVVSALRALSTCERGELRDRYERAMEAISELPCPWLRADVRDAVASLETPEVRARLEWRLDALREATSPAPGRVALLLYLPELHRGLVAELRLSRSVDGLWTHAPALLPLAREAVRIAHAAAASVDPSGQPRFLLEEHAVRIVAPQRALDEICAVDGTSLALPAALAFVSLWLGQTPSADIAATGGLERDGREVRLRAVGPGGLQAKADALAAWARGSRVRILLHDAGPQDGLARGVSLEEVSSFREAVQRCGLAPNATAGWSAFGDEARVVALLEQHIHELRTQHLEAHRIEGHSPWAVLGDRMQLLIGSLGSSHDDLRRRARAYAALAYAHAGDASAAQSLCSEGEIDPETPPPVAALVLLSNLVRAIGEERFEACAALSERLVGMLDSLRSDERRALLGVIKGTVGRAQMHDARRSAHERAGAAIPLLREAVDHHVRNNPVEAARSRVYLAMALRMAGKLDEARDELTAAEAELEEHTRPWSGTYFAATRMYVDYERARCAVAAGEHDAAVRAGARALESCDGRGIWPLAGVLRTLAWAYAQGGEPAAAGACVDRIERLALGAPAGMAALIGRIAREARGRPRGDGEVY